MNDSADASQSEFSTLFYTLHWLVVAGAICIAIVLRVQTLELEGLNDRLRGDAERLIGQREQLDVLRDRWDDLWSRADIDIDSYPSEAELRRRISNFSSVKLTKYLPDDLTNLRSKEAEPISDDEHNWIFAYTFEDSGRYVLGLFLSASENASLQVEVRETNPEYLIEGEDLIAVHEVKNIRQGWNFLACEITKREDDIRLTARLTDKTLQWSGSEELDFGSLKTIFKLESEAGLSAGVQRLWDGHLSSDGFVYSQSHQDNNPDNKPLGSLRLKSPSKKQSKHLRVDFRLSQ